jgi:hypothetical protein
MHAKYLLENLKGRDHLGDQDVDDENNIKMYFLLAVLFSLLHTIVVFIERHVST